MYGFALVAATLLAAVNAKGVFYAFSANGIDIINPVSLSVVTRLRHDLKIPGTNQVLCTYSPRYKTPCGWGGAATVRGKFVFAADSYGNRVIVIDTRTKAPIKSIATDGFPYQITYLAALDEVWVFCWKDSKLSVIGSSTGETRIHKIRKASSMMIVHTIKAQNAESYKSIMHGYLQAENCQNQNPSLKYGVVSHFSEPGIHKIDLKNKHYEKFINTSSYGCKSTLGLAYSSVTQYAFVQCLGLLRGKGERKMLIIDVKEGKVLNLHDSITAGAIGTPYASPDGKFVLVISNSKVISYYMKDRQTPIKRLQDAPANLPSRVAFVKKNDKFIAYITLKGMDKIFTITYSDNAIEKFGSISGVGVAANVTEAKMASYRATLRQYFDLVLGKTGESFSEAKFRMYIRKMFLTHVVRPIATGCGASSRFVASPAAFENKVAIIDGKRMRLTGMVDNIEEARNVIWVK